VSRSGYSDDCDDVLAMGRYIATRNKAMGGKRGQAFLSELLAALDAMPVKELVREELVDGYDPYLIALEATPPRYFGGQEHPQPFCGVCALGAVGQARGLAMAHLDPHEPEMVASAFGITTTVAREVVYANDEEGRERREELFGPWHPDAYYSPRFLRFPETPAERWARMRKWVDAQIIRTQT
jgi:hypothetical protein